MLIVWQTESIRVILNGIWTLFQRSSSYMLKNLWNRISKFSEQIDWLLFGLDWWTRSSAVAEKPRDACDVQFVSNCLACCRKQLHCIGMRSVQCPPKITILGLREIVSWQLLTSNDARHYRRLDAIVACCQFGFSCILSRSPGNAT